MARFRLAGWESARRTTYRIRGGYVVSMSVMFVASMTVTLYGVVVVLGVRPWYTPHFAIPILGMLLGNTLNGISLGLETVLDAAREVDILVANAGIGGDVAFDAMTAEDVDRSIAVNLRGPILMATA